jgi:hypothetical protein
MNEWVLVGIVVIGSVLALGGGSWVMSAISRKKDGPKA